MGAFTSHILGPLHSIIIASGYNILGRTMGVTPTIGIDACGSIYLYDCVDVVAPRLLEVWPSTYKS